MSQFQIDPERMCTRFTSIIATALLCLTFSLKSAEAQTNVPPWLSRPLSVPDAIELALKQNANILKGKRDLEAAYGVVVQTRAVVFPKVRSTGNFTANDPALVEVFPIHLPNQNWLVDVRVSQSVYEGGRLKSAIREAKLTQEQAVAQYEAVVADTILEVQVAYYDTLVALQQIAV